MAYMSQEKKSELTPAIKAVCKSFGIKATVAVRNHSTLVLNISEGAIDFGAASIQVNHYSIEQVFEGVAKEFLMAVRDAMMAGNWDKSDTQTDYYNVGWYISINVGAWNKPYRLIG